MTGRHEGPPIGSGAREATAGPYIGKRRADHLPWWFKAGFAADPADRWGRLAELDDVPDDPPRCWSCGHTTDMFCECQCCNDDHDGGPDDV